MSAARDQGRRRGVELSGRARVKPTGASDLVMLLIGKVGFLSRSRSKFVTRLGA